MQIRSKVVVAIGLAILVVATIAAYRVDSINWRAKVVGHKLAGNLEDISWSELLQMVHPGSPFYLRGLAETPNPYAAIRNPYRGENDIAEGERYFRLHCMHCHGEDGTGGVASNIVDSRLKQGDSDWAIFRTITDGIEGTGMLVAQLPPVQRWQVTGYLLEIRGSRGADISRPDAATASEISVPYERILDADSEPHNWLTYSRTYDGNRFSPLQAINRSTVKGMTLSWVIQTDISEKLEASPIVVDGMMYLSLPGGTVLAVDARSGSEIWRFETRSERNLPLCCGTVNRGVTILDDRIFVGTLDNRLQSLDVSTGRLIWESRIADHADGYSVTVAPLAVKDKIVIGVAGGEFGIRGFLDAYDAETGERAWRFHTIPAPGEPGSETWSGESWRTGGGPTWVTGSYDPELNLVYWGVGNPSPDFDGSNRPGDNLYTNSIIALNADTGELVWHYQFTPHDVHDYDANQIPVLVDLTIDGEQRSVLLSANKNAFFYILDRETGEYIGSMPFAKQTWAVEIDEAGRPVKNPDAFPKPKGTIAWPGASGATNWTPPSFNRVTGLVYIPTLNRPSVFFNQEVPEPLNEGQLWLGSATTFVPNSSETGMVAIDPVTRTIEWRVKLPDIGGRGQFSGSLSTPDLVFVGDHNAVYALDAESGEILWSSNLGGQAGSPPITYAVDGRQYMTIAAGSDVFSFSVPIEEVRRSPVPHAAR